LATKKTSSKSRASNKQNASTPPSTPFSSAGYKVQIFYMAARSSNIPKAPVKDALWFATYPLIPRLGDCLFHDGVYYKVERVFLYENTAPGWCADLEVSYYGRR